MKKLLFEVFMGGGRKQQRDLHVIGGVLPLYIKAVILSWSHLHPCAFPAPRYACFHIAYLFETSESKGWWSVSASFEFVFVHSVLCCICVQQLQPIYENRVLQKL